MDSEHRHELQQNDLEEFLKNSRAAWDKYGTQVLLVILVAVGVLYLVPYLRGREARELEAAYATLAAANSPYSKQDAARQFEHLPGYAGIALLQAADASLQQALGLANPGETPIEGEAKTNMLNEAAQWYQHVIRLNQSPLQVLNAHAGLACVYETLGQFDKAKAEYEAMKEAAGDQWPNFAALADLRITTMKGLDKPISFPEAPEKPEAIPTVSDTPAPKPDVVAPSPTPIAPPQPAPDTKPDDKPGS